MSETPPDVRIEPVRQSMLRRTSIVWLIPFFALVVALSLAWQAYSARGPVIEIVFGNGANIAPRETHLRFRDVPVGIVESVRFAEDLSGVIVSVRVDKEVAGFIDSSARFWIVRPELTTRGVSGLDTVLSGVYIEGAWDSEIGPRQTRFRGMAEAPLFKAGENGLQIALRTVPGGSLTDNSPITFRGIEVGRVGKAYISPEGSYAVAEAVIHAPHDRLISQTTRFWDTSGFSLSLGPQGAAIDFSSLATLVGGGVTFDTFVSGSGTVPDGTVFEVYPDKATARNNLFNASDVESLKLRAVFDDKIAGLAVGSAVELNGLRIGSVESVSGVIDPEAFGDSRVRLGAVLTIQPARLGLEEETSPDAALELLSRQVSQGLRARLASGSLLTGGLKIELVEMEGVEPVTMRVGDDQIPIIPSTQSQVKDVADTVEGVIARVNNLPIEDLLTSAIDFLDSARALVADADLQETPGEIRALLGEVRGIVASEDTQNIPVALNKVIGQFETLMTQLEEQDLATRLAAAVDAAAAAAGGVSGSVEGVPALVAQIEEVAHKANGLPLEDLTTQLTALVTSADAILGTEAARTLPADLGAALNEINATLAELREGGAVSNVNATLASTREAADAFAGSTEALPELIERANGVLAQASRTISGYDKGETLGREARSALRDISAAADALTALARMLERNPSALIRGR